MSTDLRQAAADYLRLRRSLGYRLIDHDWLIAQFLDHVEARGNTRITVADALTFAQAPAATSRRRHAQRLAVSDRREVFLQARAPFRPIASGTVSSTVRRACRRAGIAEVGSHRLRHTAACEMVQARVPLVQIGQVLRHQSLQSTATYARVDLNQLRLLAAPWPAGAQR